MTRIKYLNHIHFTHFRFHKAISSRNDFGIKRRKKTTVEWKFLIEIP
jgi:hypothetical protein